MPAGYPPELVQLGLLIIGAVLGLSCGLIAFYLKDVRRQLREDLKDQEEETARIRREVARLEAGLPTKYVLRDDWIRHTAGVDASLQAIAKELSVVKNTVTALAERSEVRTHGPECP